MVYTAEAKYGQREGPHGWNNGFNEGEYQSILDKHSLLNALNITELELENHYDFWQNMYDEGDDEMKRTIAKAWSDARSGKATDPMKGFGH